MKFLFIANNNIGKGFSGGDRIFTELIKNWRKDHSIILMGSEEAIKISRDRGVCNIKIIKTANKNKNEKDLSNFEFIKHIIARSFYGFRSINKNLKNIQNLDYVYSVSDFYPDLLPAFYLKLKNPQITWISGFYLFAPNPFSKKSPYYNLSFLKGWFYWLSQKISFFLTKHFADYVFVTSEPDIQKFVTRKRKKDKIIVVRGGVDLQEIQKYLKTRKKIPIEKRKWDACFLGRFHYQKGVLILPDIWKDVCSKNKNARLALIGEGPLDHQLRNKISQLKLESNIDILGFKDGNQKYDILRQSKIMVHPAIYDSGGMAAAEGMAFGLPAVSFDLEALKSYYPSGVLKAKINNKKMFAGLIVKLLFDKEIYKKTATEAKKLIENEWNWQKRSKEIIERISIL